MVRAASTPESCVVSGGVASGANAGNGFSGVMSRGVSLPAKNHQVSRLPAQNEAVPTAVNKGQAALGAEVGLRDFIGGYSAGQLPEPIAGKTLRDREPRKKRPRAEWRAFSVLSLMGSELSI